MIKIVFLLTLFLSSLFSGTGDLLNNNFCKYPKSSILYRDSESIDNQVNLDVILKSTDKNNFCQDLHFQESFLSKVKTISSQESGLLSFLFDEYVGYSLNISSSSDIVKKLMDFKELENLQNKNMKKIENMILYLGFDIRKLKSFKKIITTSLEKTDIFCLDSYVFYYEKEIDRLKILKEYAKLFSEYNLNSKMSDKIFENMINSKIIYINSLKKLFLLSLSENM